MFRIDEAIRDRLVESEIDQRPTQAFLTRLGLLIFPGTERRRQFFGNILVSDVPCYFLDKIFLDRDVMSPRRRREGFWI
jgi:hypothetical protein